MQTGKIIILNGVSSSGKSTLAAALIKELPSYLVLGFDDIVSLIRQMKGERKEMSAWDMIHHQNQTVHLATYFLHRLAKSITEYAFNLIMDTVLDSEADYRDLVETFDGADLLFVGVHCPLDELEKREQERGNRNMGLARQQYAIVHQFAHYDIEVNTYENTLEACVDLIVKRLNPKSQDS